MNTVLNYIMAFALQLISLVTPHANENMNISCPYQYEKSMKIQPHSFIGPRTENLVDNC